MIAEFLNKKSLTMKQKVFLKMKKNELFRSGDDENAFEPVKKKKKLL